MAREQTSERSTRPAGSRGTQQREREGAPAAAVTAEPTATAATTGEPAQATGVPTAGTGHLPGEPTVRWAHLPVPIGVRVRAPHMPHVSMPSPRATAQQAVRAAEVVRSTLPPPERLVYYGGLGVLAAVGVLEWPVAAAVGAGVWLAGRRTRPAPMDLTARDDSVQESPTTKPSSITKP